MSVQWGEPGLSPQVVAQIDVLVDELRQADEGRRLTRAGLLYLQRLNTACQARVTALEAFITAQGLQVPPEAPPGAQEPAKPA